MASDDEHNKGAYGYRVHGGSDDEEYDNTASWSDEEEKRMKNPWKKLYPQPKEVLSDDDD